MNDQIPPGADFDASSLSPEQAMQGFANGVAAMAGQPPVQQVQPGTMAPAPEPQQIIAPTNNMITPEPMAADPMGAHSVDALRQMAAYAYGEGPEPQANPQVPQQVPMQQQQPVPVQPVPQMQPMPGVGGVSFQQPNPPPPASPPEPGIAEILRQQQEQNQQMMQSMMQHQQQQQQMMMQQMQQQAPVDPLYEQKLMEADGVDLKNVESMINWRSNRQSQAAMQQLSQQLYEMRQQQDALIAAQQSERQASQMTSAAKQALETQFKGRQIPPETIDAIGRHAAQLAPSFGPERALQQALQGYIPILNAAPTAPPPQQQQMQQQFVPMHPGLQQVQQLPGYQGLNLSPEQVSQQYSALHAAAIQGGSGGRQHSLQQPMTIDVMEDVLAGM